MPADVEVEAPVHSPDDITSNVGNNEKAEDSPVEVSPAEVEQQEENDALAHMEGTLNKLRGDDSYDDIDQEVDNDEKKEAPEAKEGEPDEDEGVSDDADPEEGEEAEISSEDDDELAASMNEKTASRFKHFRDENKQLSADLESQGTEYTTLKESTEVMNHYINDSQITPEQLSTALSIAKAINTGQFETARAAFPRMQSLINQVAIGLGDESANVELSPRMQQSVDNLDITPDLAKQNQINEQREQMRQEASYREQQEQQHRQEQQHIAQGAAQGIKAWEDNLVVTDPDFNAKRTQMLTNSEQIMKTYHPSQWQAALQREYDTISTTMNTMAAQRTRDMARQQGVRPTASSGAVTGATNEPQSMEDVIKQGIDRMRGVG